ncbi:hypothetical protein H2204_014481 [Knufia peltigerae]|uniref:Protein kinase domain-containing protein n=1 Tax=Knufia peltigerae TaxID=1002370 RepID=A0AA38XJU3_9EURO|nr:hypothetical protein H2204_014481 [Knufia peltigerae]
MSDQIAIKCATIRGDAGFEIENRIFDKLQQNPPYSAPGRGSREATSKPTDDRSGHRTENQSLGLAHGDLRPSNLLLDAQDHLKLADSGNTQAVGTNVELGTAPYARVFGDDAPAHSLRCSFGLLGPRTEKFAMVRGYEPYDDQWYGEDHGPVTVEKMRDRR